MNRVILVGTIVTDLFVKPAGSTSMLNFTLVTSEKWTDRKSEEQKEQKEFHKIVAFGRTGEVIQQFFSKGDKILVEGKIQYRSYEKDGSKITTTQILINGFEFMKSKKSDWQNTDKQSNTSEGNQNKSNQNTRNQNKPPYQNYQNQGNQNQGNQNRSQNQGNGSRPTSPQKSSTQVKNQKQQQNDQHPNYEFENEGPPPDFDDDKIPF